MTIVWTLAALFFGSAFVVVEAVRRAPEGYEGQEGFHLGQVPSTTCGSAASEAEFIPERSQNVA